MEIKQIENHTNFNNFVKNHPLGTVHQLYEWGEFQAKSANRDKFWSLYLEDKGQIIASALVIRQKLPFNKCWLYCPRGPLTDYTNPKQTKLLFNKIAAIAKQENAIFLRFDPAITLKVKTHLKGVKGSRPAHAHYQPESTLTVDLTLSEDEILKQMKPKGRYNIKVAKKHGITLKVKTHLKGIKEFYTLLKETTARDKFTGHPLAYYQNMFTSLGPERVKLYIAEHKGQILAGAVVTYFKDTATYYFGASSNQHRNTMAPYLLHWQIMQDAKKQGYKQYDFFGIAPENTKNHPWAGVTDFKLKFGGQRINYVPAQEIVYNPFWYTLMKIAKKFRK